MTKTVAVLAFVSVLLLAPVASAQKRGRDAEAHKLEAQARRSAVSGDVSGALKTLGRALDLCAPAAACTARTRAELHVTLGSIHGISEGDYTAAKHEFVVALGLDPDVRLKTLATPELTKAFEDAQASMKPAPKPPPGQVDVHDLLHPEDVNPPPQKPEPAKPEPSKPPPIPEEPSSIPGRINWLSVHAMFDFAFLSDKNICSPGAPSNYFCTDETGAKYTGRPQPNDDDVNSGFAYSTTRLVIGFERLLLPRFTAGLFAGAGFRLGPTAEGRKAPSPIHVEARATYTFGDAAYEDFGPRFHPYVTIAGGVETVDTHVVIRVNEIPCESKVEPACKRDLNAFRVIGSGFGALGGGVRVRIEGRHAVRAGVRASLLFGAAGGLVFSPTLGYEYGL